jgi:hypothetical protein
MDDTSDFRKELGRRIAETVAKFPTKSAASKAAGVSVEQLNVWIAGEAKVPAEALWRLAQETGVDFCWLAGGQSSASAGVAAIRPGQGRVLQEATLREVLMSLAQVQTEGVTFAPERFADLVFALHDFLVDQRGKGGTNADLSGMANIIALAARSQR